MAAIYEISNLAETFQVKLQLHRSKGKLKNAPYKMDNFSKLNQFKSKSEIFADPLTAAKLPAGIDQSKKGSIRYITLYIVTMNECKIGQKKIIFLLHY